MSGKRYLYNTPGDGRQTIGVEPAGAGSYAVFYRSTRAVRLNTTHLPACPSEAACQRALDQFADKRKLEEAKPQLGGAWIQGCLPDDEIRVLVRTDGTEDPVIVAHHADGGWFGEDGVPMPLDTRVLGWMHLEAAATILDGMPF